MVRFKVTGEVDGVPVGTIFKTRKPAIRYADSLTNSEVYDTLTKEYIHGSSKFMKLLNEQRSRPTEESTADRKSVV